MWCLWSCAWLFGMTELHCRGLMLFCWELQGAWLLPELGDRGTHEPRGARLMRVRHAPTSAGGMVQMIQMDEQITCCITIANVAGLIFTK